MTRRRLLVGLGVALAVVGVTLVGLHIACIDPGAFGRIRLGMGEEEVAANLGGPAGDYTVGKKGCPGITQLVGSLGNNLSTASAGRRWTKEGCEITVWFDANGRVVAASCKTWDTPGITIGGFLARIASVLPPPATAPAKTAAPAPLTAPATSARFNQ